MKITESKHQQNFTDFDISRNTIIRIDNPVNGFTHKLNSHRSSWPFMLRAMLKTLGYTNVEVNPKNTPWKANQLILIDWGMEFRGVFNVFGGASDDLAHSLERMLTPGIEIMSAGIPMPSVSEFIQKRYKTGTERFKWLNAENFRILEQKVFSFSDIYKSKSLVIGDSHALSAYVPGSMMRRNDGMTLHGALKKGLKNLMPHDLIYSAYFYFGNIDIRHHICRRQDPRFAIDELIDEYEKQLLELNIAQTGIIGLLPIEFEGRRLPKTGYYEGTPFYGNYSERNAAMSYFNTRIKEVCFNNNWQFFDWPEIWYKMDPEVFAKRVMEARQSVHISREFYKYDMETNLLNTEIYMEKYYD